MAKFMYSDSDIRALYKDARDKKIQIKILSQMCLVSYNQMLDKLVELELMTDTERKKLRVREPEPVKADTEAMASKKMGRVARYAPHYYREGYTDIEIASKIGCSHQTVAEWRKHECLPRNVRYKRYLSEIRSMLAAGASYADITRATGVDRRTAKKIERGEIG